MQIVGEGWFGKILLVEHRGTDNEMVLKSLPKTYTAVKDFYREFHFSYHLSAHRNIVSTFDVAFQTASFYVFAQEYAPLGDLTSNISDSGIGELHSKSVAKQVGRNGVYLPIERIIVERSDYTRIIMIIIKGDAKRVYNASERGGSRGWCIVSLWTSGNIPIMFNVDDGLFIPVLVSSLWFERVPLYYMTD